MIDDGNEHKIVNNSFGSFHIHDCTVESAIALMNQQIENLGQHIDVVVQAARDKTHYLVNNRVIVNALNELLGAKLGDPLPRVTRLIHGKAKEGEENVPMVLDANILGKVMVWAQLNDVEWTELKTLVNRASYDLEDMQPKSLFLFDGIYQRAGKLEPMFVDSSTLEAADEFMALERNKWKDTARVSNVVRKYLDFINNHLSHRDNKYELGRYESA